MFQNKKNKTLLLLVILLVIGYGFLGSDPYFGHIFMILCIYSLLAASFRFVMLVGEMNIAHASFFGIGAYTSAVLTIHFDTPFIIALLVSGIVAAFISILFGLVAFRLKGEYFLLLSFGMAMIFLLFFQSYWKEYLGSVSGIAGIPIPMQGYNGFVAIMTIVLLGSLYLLEKSDIGKIFNAIHNSDQLAKSVGVNLLKYKILALAVASLVAGLSGSMFAHFNNVIAPQDFTFHLSIIIISFVIIGGKSNFFGPIVGAVVLTIIVQFIRGFGSYESLVYGLALILTMIFLPNGIVGGISKLLSMSLTHKKVQKRKELEY